MKEIPLTQGYVALVDDADYEALSQRLWHALRVRDRVYAATARKGDEKPRLTLMHRLLLQPDSGLLVTHRDGNPLNNQRENLAVQTPSDRNRTRAKPSRPVFRRPQGLSGYRGVAWDRKYEKWMAYIWANGTHRFLGYFDEKEVAARAYDTEAGAYFGEHARLNFPDPAEEPDLLPDAAPAKPRVYPKTHRSRHGSSRHKGVSFHKQMDGWQAYITVDRKVLWLGLFSTEEQAAGAYDSAARHFLGADAPINLSTEPAPYTPRVPHKKSSPYRGVTKIAGQDSWVARIRQGGNRYYLGTFRSAEAAARAYDDTARRLFGTKAVCNFPEESETRCPPE